MAKPLGLPKTGGRQKGTPNTKTLGLMQVLEDMDFDLPTKILELLPSLPTDKQIYVMLDLMAYIYPKRKASDGSAAQEAAALAKVAEPTRSLLEIEFEIAELDKAMARNLPPELSQAQQRIFEFRIASAKKRDEDKGK